MKPVRFLCLLLVMTSAIEAAPVSYRAEGTVTSFQGDTSLLPVVASVGDSFQIDFTFDTDTPDTQVFSDSQGKYAVTEFVLTVDGNAPLTATVSEITIQYNPFSSVGTDWWGINGCYPQCSSGSLDVDQVRLNFVLPGDTYSSDDLRLPPSPSEVVSIQYGIFSRDAATGATGFLAASLTSFTQIIVDDDSDGIPNSADNCPAVANPGQENLDGDEFGDACDDDIDGDGITDSGGIEFSFSIAGFTRLGIGGPAGVPTDPVVGTIVYEAPDLNSPIDSLVSVSLTIGGYSYALGDLGFESPIAADPNVDSIGAAVNGPNRVCGGPGCPVPSGVDDFFVGFDRSTDTGTVMVYQTAAGAIGDTWFSNNFTSYSRTQISGDNCPTVPNPGQVDDNGDGYGDACVAPGSIPPGADIGVNPVVGDGTTIAGGTSIGDNADIGDNVIISKDSDIGDDVTVGSGSEIAKDGVIGNGVIVGENVFIAKDVVIADGVQIGDNSVINKGVVIGVNAVIGSNVTVKKDTFIPDGTLIPDGWTVPPLP